MQISDVVNKKPVVHLNEKFTITFKIIGAMPVPFQFPFSNESLTENKIEFSKEGLYGQSA